MKIIISPAKKMKEDEESLLFKGIPVFLDEAKKILKVLKEKKYEELKEIWACNDKIAEENRDRIQTMNLEKASTPAILSYEGIAFKYMAPAVFEEEMLCYVEDKLRILSGFYGVLKPMDGILPYRLEMQAKLGVEGKKDLYSFWGEKLYKEVMREDKVLINLASKEYSKCIDKYLTNECEMITCHFGERVKERFVTKGTYAKMARGEMVRFMAEKKIEEAQKIKEFNRLGYVFDEENSTSTDYYFNRVDMEEVC